MISMARNQLRAFTKVELLVVLAIVGVLALLVFSKLGEQRKRSERISCVGKLKIMGLGYRIFATDHGDKFPMQVSTNDGGVKEWMTAGTNVYRIFQSLSNELATPRILFCFADTRREAADWMVLQNSNISYFVGADVVETNYMMILAGDRNVQSFVAKDKSGFLSLQKNEVVTWTKAMHRNAGNVVLADGSVHQLSNSRLGESLRNTGQATNRFMLPD